MRRYLDCGLFENGFTRVRCPECHDEYVLAFSCKTRELCPSCAARRAAATAVLLREEVLEEVGHAQWVFVMPNMLRPYFLHHRELVGGLARPAWETIHELMCAAVCALALATSVASSLAAPTDEPTPSPTPRPGTLAAYASRTSLDRRAVDGKTGRVIIPSENMAELAEGGAMTVGAPTKGPPVPIGQRGGAEAGERGRWRGRCMKQSEVIAKLKRRRAGIEAEIDRINRESLSA